MTRACPSERAPDAAQPSLSPVATHRKRVLIVVGSFCPAMTPDMQRARILCHELPAQGWDVEILTPDTCFQRAVNVSPGDAVFFDATTPVHRAGAWLSAVFRLARMNSIGWRSFWPMFRLGAHLLKTQRFDLIYFSTTQFLLFCLGPIWRLLYGIPYVLDFQDPWYLLKYKYIASARRWKWKLSRWLARPMQRLAVSRADAIVAVSPRYLEELRFLYAGQQFPWLAADRQAVIPFAGSTVDIETVRGILGEGRQPADAAVQDSLSSGAKLELVYVGAGGITRLKAWEAVCQAASAVRIRNPQLIDRFHFRLYGTTGDRTAPDAGLLEQSATAAGLPEIVVEHPAQVSYFRSLELAHRSAGLVVLGVDDNKYTPSKLFSYLLFEQPVLAVCHARSPAAEFLRSRPSLAHLMCFDPERPVVPEQAADALEAYLQDVAVGRRNARAGEFAEHLAPAMAREHAALFDRCLKPMRQPSRGRHSAAP
jgi:hypothetical protein